MEKDTYEIYSYVPLHFDNNQFLFERYDSLEKAKETKEQLENNYPQYKFVLYRVTREIIE